MEEISNLEVQLQEARSLMLLEDSRGWGCKTSRPGFRIDRLCLFFFPPFGNPNKKSTGWFFWLSFKTVGPSKE